MKNLGSLERQAIEEEIKDLISVKWLMWLYDKTKEDEESNG